MPHQLSHPLRRRQFIQTAALGASFYAVPGLFAEQLVVTPPVAEGPFYPDKLPLDTDNDLLVINDSITPAVGEITHLTGHVFTAKGEPVRNAFVEIWQCDSTASYVHTEGRNPEGFDSNFQGYGRFLTGVDGRYYFRTIKPVPYSLSGVFRTPHIHVAVSKNGKRIFTTQMLIDGHEANEKDGLFRRVKDPAQRKSILVEFDPLEGSKLGELTANFDIVLGKTVEELEDGKLGIPKHEPRPFRGFGRGSRSGGGRDRSQ